MYLYIYIYIVTFTLDCITLDYIVNVDGQNCLGSWTPWTFSSFSIFDPFQHPVPGPKSGCAHAAPRNGSWKMSWTGTWSIFRCPVLGSSVPWELPWCIFKRVMVINPLIGIYVAKLFPNDGGWPLVSIPWFDHGNPWHMWMLWKASYCMFAEDGTTLDSPKMYLSVPAAFDWQKNIPRDHLRLSLSTYVRQGPFPSALCGCGSKFKNSRPTGPHIFTIVGYFW